LFCSAKNSESSSYVKSDFREKNKNQIDLERNTKYVQNFFFDFTGKSICYRRQAVSAATAEFLARGAKVAVTYLKPGSK